MTLAAGTVDFLGLGAQKCGTSALTVFLGEHPELAVPQQTPGFFETGEIGDDARNRLIELFLPDAELLEPIMGRLLPWVRRGGRGQLMWRGR